jgi:hypothetical protein
VPKTSVLAQTFESEAGVSIAPWSTQASPRRRHVVERSQKTFSKKLQARDGIEKTKIGEKKTRGYRGIWVIKDVEPTRSYRDD